MVITKDAQALATRIAEAVLKDERDEGCDISAGMFGAHFSQLIRELSLSSAPQSGEYRYLVSATGYTKTENGGYSPKSFTFDVVTDGTYGSASDVSQSRPLRTRAWGHFHRLFGEYPSQDPQIDHVVLVHDDERQALTRIFEICEGAERNDVWDHVHATDLLALIPESIWPGEAEETSKTVEPDVDIDDRI